MKLLRYILFPIVPFYFLATWLRNKLYDLGIKTSSSFELPVICVGNLSVGGTGKTPMIEYLIRLLKSDYKTATLSRGYKRKTKGFVLANSTTNSNSIGDEPYQFHKKFPEVMVSVDANRRNGIGKLLEYEPKPDVILLDDAFQHRKVKAGFNILLTSYDDLYTMDMVLPTGNLREPKIGAKRANVLMVTKCPNSISESNKQDIIGKLKPLDHQHVFFSSINYSETIKNSIEEKTIFDIKNTSFTLVTGIANPKPLVEFLNAEGFKFEHLNFKDHHEFSDKDIENLKKKKLIITTEKDFMRLEASFKNSNQIFYLAINTIVDNSNEFDKLITDFISSF